LLSQWFGAAEQAINAIYALAKAPDALCADIIKKLLLDIAKDGKDTPFIVGIRFP